MVALSQTLVIILMIGMAFSLPTNSVTDDRETMPRFRRKVGNLNITTTLQQYMQDLYEEYASESENREDKPTDVWCFPDKGELSFPYFMYSSSFTYTIINYDATSLTTQMLPKNFSEQNQRGTQSVKHTHSLSSSGALQLVSFRTKHSVSRAAF